LKWPSPDQWSRLKAGVDCPLCADIHLDENPFSYKVAEFAHTWVRLPKNQYQRGWTIVFLKRHANELFELNDIELLAFWRDVANVASALDHVYRPAKINYAVFGNLCPHVHCHLIVQTHASDPTQPLNMNEHEVVLSEDEYRQIIQDLQNALARDTGRSTTN
jgi:diadenosine tetraphosphate (Ap4A) HIT family hydrolase